MEVIAAASGIAGLLSFGLQVSSGLFQLYSTIKNAPSDLKGIFQDTQALCGVLAHLKEQLGEHSIPGSKKRFSANLTVLTPALDHCQTLFGELQGKIEAANGLLRNEEAKGETLMRFRDIFRPIWERAKWPFSKDDLVKIRGRLEDAKSTLNLCLVIILVTPQLKSDVGKDNKLERTKAATAVIAAFREQQKAKQKAVAAENEGPSPVDAGVISQRPTFSAASSRDIILQNPDRDQRPRDNMSGGDNNEIELIKTESTVNSEGKEISDGKIDELNAWISVASQSDREKWDLIPVAMPVNLPQKEIEAILRDNPIPLLQALSQLNNKQRSWVISQANESGGTLVHVSHWTTTQLETVFGNLNTTSLFWITDRAAKVLYPISKTEPNCSLIETKAAMRPDTESSSTDLEEAEKSSRSRQPGLLDTVRRRFARPPHPSRADFIDTEVGEKEDVLADGALATPQQELESVMVQREREQLMQEVNSSVEELKSEQQQLKFSRKRMKLPRGRTGMKSRNGRKGMKSLTSALCQSDATIDEVPEAIIKVSAAIDEVPEAIDEVPEAIDEVPEAIDEVSEAIDEVLEAIDEVPEAIDEVPEAIDEVPEAIDEVPEAIIKIPAAIDEVPEAIIKVPAAIDEIPEAIIKVPDEELVDKLVSEWINIYE